MSPPDDPRPRSGRTLDGPWRAAIADDELRRTFLDEGFDDSAWEPMAVPSHWRTTPAFATTDGPLLYRATFSEQVPAASRDRWWLIADGVFYTSDVWLDGNYVGDTEGYFFPHTFEITDACRERSDHVLAFDVACRRELDRTRKRNLTGVFQHWDLIDPDLTPGGLWRPVHLERSGPVRITHLRVLCRDASAEVATVFVRAVLDAPESTSAELVTTLVPLLPGSSEVDEGSGVDHRQQVSLAQGENRVEWTVAVPEPRRWWPHALGPPDRYELRVEVRLPEDEPVSDHRVRRIGLRTVAMHDWIFTINGERLFIKGSNQGPVAADLAGAPADAFRRDVALAVDANLDLLRVHAHVSRPELYDAADEAGLLLWQDMPLQWGYHRSVRGQARRQARELVDLLGHHPSIVLWCGHNEPMTIELDPGAASTLGSSLRLFARVAAQQELPTWNKTLLDRTIKRVLSTCDGSRPVVAHSGVLPHPPTFTGTDTHVYLGWYVGDERALPRLLAVWPRLARFVSEFGAQAVPDDADFLHPDEWPELDWERAERRHAIQFRNLDRYVPVADHQTFESWVRATQEYQATVVRRHIETLRRLKYRPAGGFAQFHFADPAPAASWSVLDHERRPKLGFEALREACAPVIVVADRLPATVPAGGPLELDVHVVSDRRIALTDMIVHAHLHSGDGDDPVERPEQRWRWHGEIPADGCVRVGTVRATAPNRPGPLVLDLVLRDGDGVVATNRDATVVVAER